MLSDFLLVVTVLFDIITAVSVSGKELLYKSESGDIRLYNVEERSTRDIVSAKKSFTDERLENVCSMDIFISQ